MADKIPSKRAILWLAVLVSVIMYLAGVFSGLYANSILENRVQEDLNKVEEYLTLLRNYMDTSALDVKNMVLLQFYSENIEDNCKFTNLYIDNLYKQLKPYWEKLPASLEEYESGESNPSNSYISLKREYIRLSLRIWLTTKKNIKECGHKRFYPILYFYSNNCTNCMDQATEFNSLKLKMQAENRTVIVFPVDINFDDDTVYLLTKYYNITSVPAVIIADHVDQGEIKDANYLKQRLLYEFQ